MKRKPVILLSLLGAVLFTLIQVSVVVRNYQLHESNFKTNYSSYIQDALYEIRQEKPSFGFSNLWYVVDQMSYGYLKDYVFLSDEEHVETDSLFLAQLKNLILKNDQISDYIKTYLKNKNIHSEFISYFIIEQFSLMDFENEYELINNSKANEFGNYFIQPYSIRTERDNFKIEVSYFVEFKERQKLVMKEMAGMLALLILSTVLVFGIFIYTLSRYSKQKRISDLKSDFINNISHELKTPLATIGLAASSLQSEPFVSNPQKIIELAEMIKRQNKQLTGLVDNVLEAAISGKKKLTSNKTKENIIQLTKEIVGDYFEGHKDNCEIKFNLPDSDLYFDVDRLAFSTLLTNLMDNSIKYSIEKANISISIEEKNQHILICMKDRGIGIPSIYKHKVFEEFIRIPSDKLDKKVKGFGLGLFTVKRIVEEHGGTIWIESEEHVGTEVFIQFTIN